MIAALSVRLTRLETAQAPPVAIETSFTPALRLLRLLLAVHLGDLRPDEDVAAGVARALGFKTASEMRDVMVAERTALIGWGTRHNVAVETMLASHGGDASSTVARGAALTALLGALPAPFADHPDADAIALAAAIEWVSL